MLKKHAAAQIPPGLLPGISLLSPNPQEEAGSSGGWLHGAHAAGQGGGCTWVPSLKQGSLLVSFSLSFSFLKNILLMQGRVIDFI